MVGQSFVCDIVALIGVSNLGDCQREEWIWERGLGMLVIPLARRLTCPL